MKKYWFENLPFEVKASDMYKDWHAQGEVYSWCEDMFADQSYIYTLVSMSVCFKNEEDAILFKLTWA